MGRETPFRARASVTAAASVNFLASASSTRWQLLSAFIGWANCNTATKIGLYESGTKIVEWAAQTTAGSVRLEFPHGYGILAATVNSGLSLNTDNTGTVTGYFVGTTRS